jgi:wyosine [tRNA(Phe)-imidazoG37] synthetase (radical SAM superfamily)
MRVERRRFYDPDEIVRDVRDKVRQAAAAGAGIDYICFVPDGEPTLDVHLGYEIEQLKPLGLPIGVITNGSLLSRPDVRAELMQADWVSCKVDAVCEPAWRSVDRPRGSLQLAEILDGVLFFARAYGGELVTETMLVAGSNDGEEEVRETAAFLARVQPATAYLSIPTRPPAETWVRPPDEAALNRAYQILSEQVPTVEYLIGYEGNAFASTGDVQSDLLSITAVHPMREDAVQAFLARAEANWDVVEELVALGQLVQTSYNDHGFYVRALHRTERP